MTTRSVKIVQGRYSDDLNDPWGPVFEIGTTVVEAPICSWGTPMPTNRFLNSLGKRLQPKFLQVRVVEVQLPPDEGELNEPD